MTKDDLEATLQSFVHESADTPVVWGESDCTSWVAKWIESVHGRPVKRPPWTSQNEARRLIIKAGSLLALWQQVLDDFGLVETFIDPQPGDVGLIDTHSAGPVGGIFLQHGTFAWRAEPAGARIILPRRQTIIKTWAIR